MASKSFSLSHLCSKQTTFLIFLLVSITLALFVLSVKPKRVPNITITLQVDKRKPAWFDVIEKNFDNRRIMVGLVNIDTTRMDANLYEQLDELHPQVESLSIDFDHVDENLKWKDFFPVWIDEDEKWGKPKCKDLPMPTWEDYRDVNVVVARVPCGKGSGMEGVRDVFRLQVNLVVANLAVESGRVMKLDAYEPVYVVFIGSCGPMVDIFKCDDLLFHQLGEYWVYKPDLRSLRQKMLMPVGSCQIAPGYAETGKEVWRAYISQSPATLKYNYTMRVLRLAYVTVLHSSEAYVCGAITLAQSILQTEKSILQYNNNYTRDLLLLADESIGPKSIRGLKASGWKIKRIQRILNPFAKKGSYNEWNYSKLRIWQLTMYDKIIFLDSDLLVLKNIDAFFAYPQLSASPNDFTLFNSGLMVIEPSLCMFENSMQKTLKVKPYNGGDQGLVNEIFTWWHRLPRKLNYLKSFQQGKGNDEKHEIPEDLYVIHYLGLKPWMCYRDYDCNWDMKELHVFASDLAHKMWWKVYHNMPKELQSYCGLIKKMDERIKQRRRRARNASLCDGHWKIVVKDPRRKHYEDLD
ncbi:putative UDP-glucuronate:xylan alpha-glucuronosyltransferase 4 [Gastrolobium bilobum]|uniref:putative UDP-glucuronate:xylan alpha-glucuronosyltransferase 4 n=1 Tax=Gastrolobium bilobum TaxID=150636 RepID=UPI002AB22244|nr:putative UDP-glucuronate:xylan alpha-glucuronosyltransferase 4 [Gastrolobium bilobum]